MSKTTTAKKNYHSTVSNQEYMSKLGKASGVTGLEERYKDLDDMISSDPGRKLPFWVKEVDEPTVEIDWDVFHNFPSRRNTLFLSRRKARGLQGSHRLLELRFGIRWRCYGEQGGIPLNSKSADTRKHCAGLLILEQYICQSRREGQQPAPGDIQRSYR